MAIPRPSDLDANQCIQGAYDDATGRLRVDAELTASIIAPPGLEVSISAIDDNIAIRNSNNNNELLINPDGSINVNTSVTISSVDQGAPNTDANAWPVKLVESSVQIFTTPFDSITATYPSSTQEVYKSRIGGIGGTVQETVTINYTDASKNLILNLART